MVARDWKRSFNPMIGFLPQLGLAAVLLIGGNAVIHAHLTLGQFTAFYLYLNMLIAPMRTLGVILNLASARPPPARACSRSSTVPAPDGAARRAAAAAGNGHVQLQGVTLRYDESDEFGAAYSATNSTNGATATNGDSHAPARGRC